MTTTDPRTEEIRKRLKRAAPIEYWLDMTRFENPVGVQFDDFSDPKDRQVKANRAFVKHSAADVRHLLDRIEALEAVADKAATVCRELNLNGSVSITSCADLDAALADASIESLDGGEPEPITDHAFRPVYGHPDDDECTYRNDGTDLTYCGEPRSAHRGGDR